MFLSAPGKVAADTKQFLYLDPRWLLGRAASLWDASTGLGTVTHQNIGYLWPMGPWFALCDMVGVPMWIAQRIWLGALLFAAACGVRWMCRHFSLTGPAVAVASLLYALSPYQLAYMGRTSVILLPWAGLPWLIGLAVHSGRTGRWRQPALFALAVVTIGAINASSLLYIGVAPLLWFPFAIWVARELSGRAALAAMARIGACTVPVQLWWMAGLRTQAAHGLPILHLTETLETVASTATSSELLRGLGYWYFYGKDNAFQWTDAVNWYTQNPALIVLSFTVPALGMLAAVSTRWRYRTYFVALVVVGLALAVGTHPYDDPAPLGSVIKSASSAGTAAFAMRNSPRALPLVALSLAVLTAVGLTALCSELERWRAGRHRAVGPAAIGVVALMAVANLPPLWTAKMVQPQLQRPEDLPDYWTQAASDLDAMGSATRVLELPGQDFGAYRWGTTQDVITRGLMDRPWVGRELIPFGSPQSADLLRALDRRIQEGTLDPAAIAPLARLMAAGTVLLRTDAEYERFVTPRPRVLQQLLTPTPVGLDTPRPYGPATPNRAGANQPLLDETELGTDPATPWPSPLLSYEVTDPVAIAHAETTDRAVVVVGSAEGIVDAAEALIGALDAIGSAPLFFAADLPTQYTTDDAGAVAPSIVLTDSNRRRAERWGTLRENFGYTETAGERPMVEDPKDTRLAVFPDATDAQRSVTVYGGNIATVRATRYGNPVSFSPEDRPANALDGDVRTAWRTGAFERVGGERWRVDLRSPVTADHVMVVQPVKNRFITKVTVRLSDGAEIPFDLGEASFTPDGQRLDLGSHTFDWLEIRVDAANFGKRASYLGLSTIGFNEVRIAGVGPSDERVVLPTIPADLDQLGSVDVVLTRLRANPAEQFKLDTETRLARRFTAPAGVYTISGTARLHATASDTLVDTLTGRTGPVTAESSDRLTGSRDATASSAIDGDVSTFWSPGYGPPGGRWIEVAAPAPVTFDHLDLAVIADGRHSVPTKLTLIADDSTRIEIGVPHVADGADENHVEQVTVPLPSPLSARRLRVELTEVRTETSKDLLSAAQVELPVAIAELGAAGLTAGPRAQDLDSGCRGDLLTIGTTAVSVRITGSVSDAIAGRQLVLTPCDEPTMTIGDEPIDVTTAVGLDTGLDIDRLVLHRDALAGGASAPTTPPAIDVVADGQHSLSLRAIGARAPFWLVLGQSHSDGWHASINGTDLGAPQLIDGYANGWLIDPVAIGLTDDTEIAIDWTPQRLVTIAMWASVLAAIVCLALVVKQPRSDGGRPVAPAPQPVGRPPLLTIGPTSTATVAVVVAAAFLAWLLAGVLIAAATAVASLAALSTRYGRVFTAVAPWAFFGPIALATAAGQMVVKPKPGVEWPIDFDPSHQIMLLAVSLLVADTLVCFVRSHR